MLDTLGYRVCSLISSVSPICCEIAIIIIIIIIIIILTTTTTTITIIIPVFPTVNSVFPQYE